MGCLFISASFFGYAKKISIELERRFGKVYWFEDRPVVNVAGKAICRAFPDVSEKWSYYYFQQIASNLKSSDIKCVFVIKGEMLSEKAILMLRDTFPKAQFYLYFWDSFGNMPKTSRNKIQYFDHAYSFDPVDVAENPALTYRPLFYLDDYKKISEKKKYNIDLLFIGTAHSDRYRVINKIKQGLPSSINFKVILYSPSKAIHFLKSVIKPDLRDCDRKDFVFSPLTSEEVLNFVAQSKVVIDIERNVQTGYTMRTIEMLAASRKIITTNPTLLQADFYNKNNILVVDRHDPKIDLNFIKLDWMPVPNEILNRYSFARWFADIFDH